MCGTQDETRGVVTEPTGGALAGSTYHVYAVKWTASTVTWYVDGVQQGRPQTNFDSGSQKMLISLTMQACGWDETNDCNASTSDPLVTEVDWVRVWQR